MYSKDAIASQRHNGQAEEAISACLPEIAREIDIMKLLADAGQQLSPSKTRGDSRSAMAAVIAAARNLVPWQPTWHWQCGTIRISREC